MVSNRQDVLPGIVRSLTDGIDRVTRKEDNVYLDGQAMAEGLFGDAMATNNFMVGVAFQAGTIPLKAESIETAIKKSGVGVEHEPGRVPLGPHGGGRSCLRRGRDRQGHAPRIENAACSRPPRARSSMPSARRARPSACSKCACPT